MRSSGFESLHLLKSFCDDSDIIEGIVFAVIKGQLDCAVPRLFKHHWVVDYFTFHFQVGFDGLIPVATLLIGARLLKEVLSADGGSRLILIFIVYFVDEVRSVLLGHSDRLSELAHFNVHMDGHFDFLRHDVAVFCLGEVTFFAEGLGLSHENVVDLIGFVLLCD